MLARPGARVAKIGTPSTSDGGQIPRAVAIEAKLGDDYEPNDQGLKAADVPVLNAYHRPSDRARSDKPNYRKSHG